MHIQIGDIVRYDMSVRENPRQNYRVVSRMPYPMATHYYLRPITPGVENPTYKNVVVDESAIQLPFNAWEYGGPLGTGIRITNPGWEKVCGHPNFKQYKSEWAQLVNSTNNKSVLGERGSDPYDPNGHCIWWSVIYATFMQNESGAVPDVVRDFLERWKVRPVPRRLIDEDCLVWWPTDGHPIDHCFEKKLLGSWTCPTCDLNSRGWNQNQAWLQYCSEACYNGVCPEEGNMIDADDAYYKMEQHCKALEDEVRRLDLANVNGSQELQETKNKLIEISKAKTEMHKRAQKAESEKIKVERRMNALSKGLADEIKEKAKYQSRCDDLKKENKKLRKEAVEANTPRGIMKQYARCGNDRGLGFWCAKLPGHAGPCHTSADSPVNRETIIQSEPYQNCRKQLIAVATQRNVAKARVAELELVVKDLERDLQIHQHANEAPVAIASVKYQALQTLIRYSAGFGSLYYLLQYLTG